MFINGKWITADSLKEFKVYNPATGESLEQFQMAERRKSFQPSQLQIKHFKHGQHRRLTRDPDFYTGHINS